MEKEASIFDSLGVDWSPTLVAGSVVQWPKPCYLVISSIIKIDMNDGSVEMLPGFTTNEAAAKAFWDAVRTLAPSLPHHVEP